MANGCIHITAKDCLPFDDQESIAEVAFTILRNEQFQTFHFAPDYISTDDEKLIEFDYLQKVWKAGRYVGEMEFHYKNQPYKLTIKPRFGEIFLFRMLEEIYNIKILPSQTKESSSTDWQNYIKRIVSFIWLHKLAACNRYGIPKQNFIQEHKGTPVKGRLNVRKSVLPYYINSEVVSESPVKREVEIVSRILWQANRILVRHFDMGIFKMPDAAKDAMDHVSKVQRLDQHVSEYEYRNIKLKAIYQNWKSIIDFSWDILKSKPFHKKDEGNRSGYSFFIDMAEVWELYLKSLLKKELSFLGWTLRTDNLSAYPSKYFSRKLIPDIVFERNNEVLVWDAKYKRMTWSDRRDFDRTDFFQIHTYMNYYEQNKTVKCGGLLYPLSNEPSDRNRTKSDSLFGLQSSGSAFVVDGIDFSFCSEEGQQQKELQNLFRDTESKFLNRMKLIAK